MVIARYNGTCPRCRMAIIPGHRLTKVGRIWAHVACRETSEEFNLRWAQLKNEAARREDEQERAVYEAEMKAEAALFKRVEGGRCLDCGEMH